MQDIEEKRGKRRRLTTNAINRQKRIAKNAWNAELLLKQPHRFAKHHALDCGRPGCMVCGNPRKLWKQRTFQEKKMMQERIDYEPDSDLE